MDRLSRDQKDIAGLFKRMSYADVKMFTLSEGEVSHLHVGLKGTMNALYETLQDDSEEKRIVAADAIRSLVDDIVLTPVDGKVEIDVRGDLAGILTLSVKKQTPQPGLRGRK